MQNSQNKKALQIGLFVLVAIVVLGVGYAAISAVNLIINGNATASVNQNNFKVHFTQAQAISGSTGASGTSAIDSQDDTKAMFDVTGLTKEGDYAEAVYTVKNDSNGIGAAISLSVTNSNSEYFKVTETIQDDKLQSGEETTATVKVEMIKTPITDSVSTSITAALTASPLENSNATGGTNISKIAGEPESFATDSWSTIKKAVQDNNISSYNIGDTKTITINGIDYTVRLSNKTTGEHCGDNDTAYSQTACGFVVEFVDCVTSMQMRSPRTNVGGYPATQVFDYLNNTLFGQLSENLQEAIKPTRVISGYGNNGTDSDNFTTSNQKLYLLSGEEIYGIDEGGNNYWDKSTGTSHQLEYYSDSGVTYRTDSWTGTNLDKTIKQYNSSNIWWWLRNSSNSEGFSAVRSDGKLGGDWSTYSMGVSPAFRIG